MGSTCSEGTGNPCGTDIPEVLKPLVEFEEEGGTPIEWCDAECGDVLCGEEPLTNWQDEPFPQWTAFNEDTGEEMLCVSACPRCGTLVGATEDGRPYRIPFAKIMGALEHRDRALEWLAVHVAWWSCVTPCPHGYVPNSKDECGHEPEECWVTAALKAAEEAES